MKPPHHYDLDFLFDHVTENKREKINQIIKNRTRYITIVLENISQSHNASAILRTCDILGIQDIHIVESSRTFSSDNEISKGASKWIDVYHHATIQDCAARLKEEGYRLVATTPHERGYSLSALSITNKIALMFGTESVGLSKAALAVADDFVTIPMYGFTESFNISVSVGICLYDLTTRMRAADISWQLISSDSQAIQRVWLERILHMAEKP
jgi:tRNA (guanosine-2'-O-)-methyltransferase